MQAQARFLASALPLLGFRSPCRALVQSVRELVDNAVDACRRLVSQQSMNAWEKEMHVAIKIQSATSDLIIEVSDNGIGMQDISSHFQIFFSQTEQEQLSGRIGKYGVGLSATLFYAYLHSQIPAKVITKSQGSKEMVSAEIELEQSMGPQLRSQRTLSYDCPEVSGTSVRIHLGQIESNESLQQGTVH
jgi:DNA topoisomerase VI subunit B